MRRRDLLSMAVVAAVCAVSALAQGDTIYRCNDGQGRALYQNTPCAGGRTVALQDTKPDPAARERLQRELEAFDRRQALRDAAQLRERERQVERNRVVPPATEPDPPPVYGGYFYPYAPYYGEPPQQPRPPRPRVPAQRPASFVPVR